MDNPIREYRKFHQLTQAELAEKANVTRQVITRLEAGTFQHIPPSVASIISVPSLELQVEFHNWQRHTRFKNRAAIKPPHSYGSCREFRGSRSVAGFCKLLCIHPAQWDRLEKHGGDDTFFIQALSDAGLRYKPLKVL